MKSSLKFAFGSHVRTFYENKFNACVDDEVKWFGVSAKREKHRKKQSTDAHTGTAKKKLKHFILNDDCGNMVTQ